MIRKASFVLALGASALALAACTTYHSAPPEMSESPASSSPEATHSSDAPSVEEETTRPAPTRRAPVETTQPEPTQEEPDNTNSTVAPFADVDMSLSTGPNPRVGEVFTEDNDKVAVRGENGYIVLDGEQIDMSEGFVMCVYDDAIGGFLFSIRSETEDGPNASFGLDGFGLIGEYMAVVSPEPNKDYMVADGMAEELTRDGDTYVVRSQVHEALVADSKEIFNVEIGVTCPIEEVAAARGF